MVKHFLHSSGECWIFFFFFPTTWLLANIILWAPDQISPPSHSLCVTELQSQTRLHLTSRIPPLLSLTASLLQIPTRAPSPSHCCSCLSPSRDFCHSHPASRGSSMRRELGKVRFRSVNSRVRGDGFDLHTIADQNLRARAKKMDWDKWRRVLSARRACLWVSLGMPRFATVNPESTHRRFFRHSLSSDDFKSKHIAFLYWKKNKF